MTATTIRPTNRTIDQAYTAVRAILTAHPDYGFYIV